MAVDGAFERLSILERARAYVVGGRVHDGVPDDTVLARGAGGSIKPYVVASFQSPYAVGAPGDRSIMGEEEQPHVMPFRLEAWATTAGAAETTAGALRELFIGWEPSPAASEIRTSGTGRSFANRNASAAPTRFVETVPLEVTINLGELDGLVPGPGDNPAGGEQITTIEDIVRALLAEMPGPNVQRYDFGAVAAWPIEHTLGRVPSVEVYSLDGERYLPDVVATPTQVLVTFADPTPGFAILT